MTASRELDAAAITDPALRAGYALCRRTNASHGRSFYLATLLLPPAKRPYVHALYGFARHADDIVDDMSGTPRQRADKLAAFGDDFLVAMDWGAASDPVLRAVIDTARHWQLPARYFADFLDAMRSDLTVTDYPSFDALCEYMWGSAAVIGLQMLPVLGKAGTHVDDDRLSSAAVDLGMAFQLTNFVRDVGDDLLRGRVYLPTETLHRFGVDRARLQRRIVDEPVRNVLAFEIERARGLYRRAAPGVELVDPTSRDCLRTAITLYSAILDRIEAADYDVFTRRATVTLPTRAAVGLTGARRAWSARRGARDTPTDSASPVPARSRTEDPRPARTRRASR
jgi:phytoene synthase